MNIFKKFIILLIKYLIFGALFYFVVYTDYINPFKEYIPIIWTIILIYSINYSSRYRKKRILNELRFPTNNYDFNKTYNFISGSLVVISGILGLIFIENHTVLWSLISLNGFLLIILGFYFIPNGIISISNNKLKLKCENQIIITKTDEVTNLLVNENQIVLTKTDNKKHRINHLNLNEMEVSEIIEFLNEKLHNKVEIKNIS